MAVLNSKKAKLRELRDKLATLEPKTAAQGAQFETEDETGSEEEVEDNDSKENPNSNEKERKEETLFSSASASGIKMHLGRFHHHKRLLM